MLLLVLCDHPVDEAAAKERGRAPGGRTGEQLQRARAHPARILKGLLGLEERKGGAGRAGMLKGIVERVHIRPCERLGAQRAHQPLLLVVRDVRHVPDDGGHQRRVRAGERVAFERAHEREQARAGGLERRVRTAPPAVRRRGVGQLGWRGT